MDGYRNAEPARKLASAGTTALMVLAAGAICAVLIAMATTWALVALREAVMIDARREQENLLFTISAQADRALNGVASVLNHAADHTDPIRSGEVTPQGLYTPFIQRAAEMPQLDALALAGADGQMLFTSRPAPLGMDLTDRWYFQVLRDDPGRGMVVSSVTANHLSGLPAIIAARRLPGPDGQFTGVALAVLSPRYFSELMIGLDLLPGTVLALVDSQGKVALVKAASGTESLPAVLRSPEARNDWAGDGPEGHHNWITSGQALGGGAMWLVAATDLHLLLAPWRRLAYGAGLAAGSVAVVLVVLSAYLARAVRRVAMGEALFSTVFHTSPDAVAITRLSDGTYVDINEGFERTSGWSRAEILGRSSGEIGIWADADDRARLMETVLRDGRVRDAEIRFRRRDGGVIIGLMSLSAVRVRGEGWVFSITKDISARKEDEVRLRSLVDQLISSNTELEQFAYVASHDLKEPLRSIVSYSQLLERRAGDYLTADHRDMLTFIVAAGKRMHDLVNDLLAYSRVGSRAEPFVAVPGDDIVAGAIGNLQMAIGDTGATIKTTPLPMLLGDPHQMLQVFQNLIANALKFRHPAQAIHIAISWTPAPPTPDGQPMAEIVVQDNGIGIDPAHHERIFEIFRRLHTERDYPGTGIGLAICRRIVERHQGRIRVTSRLGEGATFHVTLPRSAEAPPPTLG